MLEDVIELRANKWVPRRKDDNPKTIKEIHREAEEKDLISSAASSALLNQRGGQRSNPNISRSSGGKTSVIQALTPDLIENRFPRINRSPWQRFLFKYNINTELDHGQRSICYSELHFGHFY